MCERKQTTLLKKIKKMLVYFSISLLVIAVIISTTLYMLRDKTVHLQPDELLQQYMSYINEGNYEKMYALLSTQTQSSLSKEDFISKNKKIYEGMDAHNVAIEITKIEISNKNQMVVSYDTTMDTLAGEISFSNSAVFTKNKDRDYGLVWLSQLIFPMLNSTDKVKVITIPAERGNILDRNGEMLAGKGLASSIGFVPGKMSTEKEVDIANVSALLDIPAENIQKKLSASYVKEDTFVPIKTIAKGQQALEDSLLKIKGIKITDVTVRSYPFGEKTSHLTGYIQAINKEELERLASQHYNANSVLGKSGLEKIYESQLHGTDGYEIMVVDSDGNKKELLARKDKKNGESIKLTIDVWLQSKLYDQFAEDKSFSVAMNPQTGEVLALVSTPTFNANDFVLGMSTAKWNELNENENKPLYNRYKSALCPGSSFKPIVAAIGLTTGIIKPEDNYGHSGRSWQKDASWGLYKVTTMKDYGDQVTLQNALLYSDNIYFAKAALKIGADILSKQLLHIGFDEPIPFEFGMYSSSFSNSGTFDSEIQLADSGYGQGQILINPLHMACLYSAFVNEGNMVKPYLIYNGSPAPTYWKENIFSKEAAEIVRKDLIQVVEHPHGTGRGVKINDVVLAAKTGTAEIKATKEDKTGTELGWFGVFTADKSTKKQLLVITMVEDVKERGGSSYVIKKMRPIFYELTK